MPVFAIYTLQLDFLESHAHIQLGICNVGAAAWNCQAAAARTRPGRALGRALVAIPYSSIGAQDQPSPNAKVDVHGCRVLTALAGKELFGARC